MPSSPSLSADARITIRPLLAEDREALSLAFERMSDASRYQRFLSAMPRLSDSQLTYLTDVDQLDHVAIAAVDASGIVGVARSVRVEEHEAEMAIAVVDDRRGSGLGGELVAALVGRAGALGVKRFQATVLADNVPMLRLLRALGEMETTRVGSALLVRVALPRAPVESLA